MFVPDKHGLFSFKYPWWTYFIFFILIFLILRWIAAPSHEQCNTTCISKGYVSGHATYKRVSGYSTNWCSCTNSEGQRYRVKS